MSDRGSSQSFAISRNLQNVKIIFEGKIYKNIRISDTIPNSVSTSTWLCVTSKMKNSSHKTWQTSHLFLKPLQIQTYEKNVGRDMAYYVPRLKKWGRHLPRVPHQIAPMVSCSKPENMSGVSRAILFLILDLTCFMAENMLQTSSALFVQALSVWEHGRRNNFLTGGGHLGIFPKFF